MKKRLLAILMCAILVMQVFPAVVFAGGTSGTYAVALHVEENSNKKYLGKDTFEVSFGVQSDDLMLKGNMAFGFAVDLTVFDLLTKNGKLITDTFLSTGFTKKNSYVYRTLEYELTEDEVIEWNNSVAYAVSKDGKTAYVSLQPYQEDYYQPLTTEVRLESILIGLKEGKTIADLSENSVRMMTLEEADTLGENILNLTDGNTIISINKSHPTSEVVTPVVDWSSVPLVKNAATPVITAQPQGAEYIQNATATALSVTATVSDTGTLSYQWYKSETDVTAGGEAVGTDATYTPSTAEIGTSYYYVVITNTNNSVEGNKTATVVSSTAAVTVTEDPDLAALAEAFTDISSVTYSMDQKDVISEDSIKTYITETVTPSLPTGVTVSSVNKVEYTAATEGTSADADGSDGSYVFTLTLTKNSKNATSSGTYTVTINATQYDGITDVDAVAAAIAGVAGGEVNVDFGATADDIKTAVGNYVAAEIDKIDDAAGVTGSVELKEGTTYTVTFSKGSVVDTKEITMTVNVAPDPNIKVVEDALTAANGASYQNMKQADATSEDVIKSALKSTADTAIDNSKVTVEIIKVSYTEAVAGTSATPAGTNGTFTFKVKVTAGEQTRTTDEKSITINATVFDGVTDEQAVNLAKTAIEGLEWNDIAQATANTKDGVKEFIENKVKTVVNNDSVTVTVTVEDASFTAAIAGSAATSHEGKDGEFTFSVMVEKGVQNATPVESKTLAIIATEYSGVLDSEAVKAAKDAVDDGVVEVAFGADQTAKEEAVQAYVDDIISKTADAAGVTAIVTFSDASSYIVEYFKNDAYDFETVEMTVNEAPDPDIAIIAAAKTKLGEISWDDVDQETLNTKALAEAFVEETVKTAVDNEEVDVTVTITSFTAAVAGSASTSNEGTDGSFTFTVKLEKGEQSYTTETPITVNIIATKYLGKLDVDAVADAKDAIEGIDWADIDEDDANTQEDVKSYIEGVIDDEVDADDEVTVTVEVTAFTAATAGTAATSHEGTDGSFTFSVTVEKGSESAAPVTGKTLNINATEYDGVLDVDAVAAAKAALTGDTVGVDFGATQADKTAAVQDYVDELLAEVTDAAGVTATVSYDSGNNYSVSLEKGTVSDSKTISMTVNVAPDPDIALVAAALTAVDEKVYSNAKQKNVNTEAQCINKISNLATQALTAAEITSGITVTVETVSFTAAVAGSADTTNAGVNGTYKFKVTVTATKGSPSGTTAEKTITINATAYEGVLNADAVAAAKTALINKNLMVRHNATPTEKSDAVTNYLNSLATGTAAGVTVSIKSKSGDSYTVAFDKGLSHDEKTVTITVEEEALIVLDKPVGLTYKNRVLTWTRVPHASCYKVYVTLNPNTSGYIYEFTTLGNELDLSGKLTDGEEYIYTVRAIGDQIDYDNSPISAVSAPFKYTTKSLLQWNSWWIATQVRKIRENNAESDKAEEPKTDVEAEPTEETVSEWVNPFTDIFKEDEYYDAIKFVNEKGLYNGVSETKFAPHSTMTRAMFVTVLGRLAGIDTEKYTEVSFDDAEAGQWYSAYVEWAAENNIINGYGNGKFGVNDEVTIEQAAAIIARYARFIGIDTADEGLADYDDKADVSDWAVDDMAWLTASGIYAPADNKLSPKAKAERQLVATMMFGFVTVTTEAE